LIEDVARRTGKDRSTLYRLETAQQRPQRATLIQLLDLYQVEEPRRRELLLLLREASQRGWMQTYRSELPGVYSDYIGFEEEARAISNYESLFIPGLLQTEDYARAQLHGTLPHATGAEIENRVTARLERQQLLTRPDPPRLWAIIDEAAARRHVGGPGVMAAQLARLAEAAAQPHITVQLIPFDAGAHPGMDGSFVVLEFPDPARPSPSATPATRTDPASPSPPASGGLSPPPSGHNAARHWKSRSSRAARIILSLLAGFSGRRRFTPRSQPQVSRHTRCVRQGYSHNRTRPELAQVSAYRAPWPLRFAPGRRRNETFPVASPKIVQCPSQRVT
jgi:transcriptional regulator with XRE-family HTH domain